MAKRKLGTAGLTKRECISTLKATVKVMMDAAVEAGNRPLVVYEATYDTLHNFAKDRFEGGPKSVLFYFEDEARAAKGGAR